MVSNNRKGEIMKVDGMCMTEIVVHLDVKLMI